MKDDFIGETFPTPKGGLLTVVSVVGKSKNSIKKYGLTCSICHEDAELFPELFESQKSSLINDSVPCGCAKNPKWSEQQVNIIIRRLCEKEGYEYLGFHEGYKNCYSKFEYNCPVHGVQKASYNSFVNSGSRCPDCGGKKKKSLEEAENIVKELCESEGYEFIGFPEGYENCYSKFEYNCHTHGKQKVSYNNFVNGTRCSSCTGNRGYQKSKTGIFYVVKWTNSNGDCWFKFGITGKENPETRMKQQVYIHKRKMNEELKYEIRYMCSWDDGNIVYSLEREFVEIQNKYGTYCNKEMMCDGFTETITLESVKDLQEAIKNTTWVDVDLVNDVPYIQLA